MRLSNARTLPLKSLRLLFRFLTEFNLTSEVRTFMQIYIFTGATEWMELKWRFILLVKNYNEHSASNILYIAVFYTKIIGDRETISTYSFVDYRILTSLFGLIETWHNWYWTTYCFLRTVDKSRRSFARVKDTIIETNAISMEFWQFGNFEGNGRTCV